MPGPNTDLEALRERRLSDRERERVERERREQELQRRRELIARKRAEHAAAFAAPLIDESLLTTAERNAIRKRIRHARPVSELLADVLALD